MGFVCWRNCLIVTNVVYLLFSVILMALGGGLRYAGHADVRVAAGVIVCGVFLMLLAVCGLVGACKHHQVLLFFYMTILFLLFLVQFAIGCACLALNEAQRKQMVRYGWHSAASTTRQLIQQQFHCCGALDSFSNDSIEAAVCEKLTCCTGHQDARCCGGPGPVQCPCSSCVDPLAQVLASMLNTAGGISLFFSFIQLIGVFCAFRFRNQKDPRADPRTFL